MGNNMADRDELARLEAERDRLLSMIGFQKGPFYQIPLNFRMLAWFVVVAIIFVAAALNVAGILAGQISVSGLVFSVVGLALLAYILVRRNTVFDSPFFAGEILVPSGMASSRRRRGSVRLISVLRNARHAL
jgi:uncharacterized membrane protein